MFTINLYKSLVLISAVLLFIVVITGCNQRSDVITNNKNQITPFMSPSINKQIIDINDTEKGVFDKQDFTRFAEKIANAHIVGLGEQTHGTGSVFALKSQLIQYLHEEHGFDVLIFESGMYDVNAIWQQAKSGQRIKDIAPGNIFYMYANSDEVTPLFDYINQQEKTESPLILVGFDSQHTGGVSNKSLVDDLENAFSIAQDNWSSDNAWLLFKEQIQQVLNISHQRLSVDAENVFFVQLDKVQQVFLLNSKVVSRQKDHENDSYNQSGFWYRITRGLEAQAKRQWKISDIRSQEMGENIKWWASQYPDKKILIWAHSGHLYRTGDQQINAGEVISNAFADQYYMVHFTANSGKFLDYAEMKIKEVSATHANSFENKVDKINKTNLSFVDTRSFLGFDGEVIKTINQGLNEKLEAKVTANLTSNQVELFVNDYRDVLPISQWYQYIDGVFVFKNVWPAHYNHKVQPSK